MPFLFCRPLFPFSGCGVSVELLVDLSLSNVDLRACEIPSFVGREMLNLFYRKNGRKQLRSGILRAPVSSGIMPDMKRLICFLICIMLCITCSGGAGSASGAHRDASLQAQQSAGREVQEDAAQTFDRLTVRVQDLEPARRALTFGLSRPLHVSAGHRLVRGSSAEPVLLFSNYFKTLLPAAIRQHAFLYSSPGDDASLEIHSGRFPPI